MSDAYNVRSDGQRYYVYRLDGNVAVAEFFNASEAQATCARMNQDHNERFSKKKEPEPQSSPEPNLDWAGSQLKDKPNDLASHIKAENEAIPDPPPGQGVSY